MAVIHPILLAFIGTLFTYGMTAVGSAVVYLIPVRISYAQQRKVLDAALGFAGGVMIAASCFGLLIPSMKFAAEGGLYGKHTWVPAAVGIMVGAVFVHFADKLIPHEAGDAVTVLTGASAMADDSERNAGKAPASMASETADEPKRNANKVSQQVRFNDGDDVAQYELQDVEQGDARSSDATLEEKTGEAPASSSTALTAATSACTPAEPREPSVSSMVDPITGQTALEKAQSWRRILLLVVAIVIHNFPEGLAVGVTFGALADVETVDPASPSPADIAAADATNDAEYQSVYSQAYALALGIGLQDFPEGLAVSLPLMRVGYSRNRAFWYGQLSGMVEPIGGVIGAFLVAYISPLLPFALAFAAGAMIFVVIHDIVPETLSKGGYPMLSVYGFMIGFVIMMSMDVALG